jgi:nitrogen-specific signal transduction histidine kinase/ActR/RegA family two-component response regulator
MCVGLVLGCLSLGTLWRAKVLVSRKLDKANQRQLVEQRNQAAIEKVGAQQEKLDSLSTMCAGVMHDFNNYLLAIIAEAEHGAVQAAPQQSSRSFRNIMDSAELASGLTKDLSNYIGAGKMSFSSRDLNQELLNALPILQSISNNRIRLKTDDVSIPVAVDSAAFRNVMINLVKNAVEASSDDQEIIVSTRLEKASKMGGLSIIDSGVGMSRESIDKVFDPFFTSKGLGRGLGLPSAKGIVESHGGEMQIIPRSTNGTKVDVLLPVTDSPVSTAIDLDSANKLSYVKYSIPSTVVESSSTSDCRTILFVDDDEMVRRAISSILGTRYETSMASSAEEALIALSIPENNITCVITDYSLPGSSGVELAEEVSHRFSGIPVILISGFPEKNVAESNFISEFLPKPFTRNALLSAIDKAMDGKKTLDFTR